MPTAITLYATIEGTIMADQFPAGQSIALTAVVDNAEGVAVPDTLTWTSTAGTVTADDASTLTATLVNAPVGSVTVTATDPNGLSGSVTFDVTDNAPSSITVTAAAATAPAPTA